MEIFLEHSTCVLLEVLKKMFASLEFNYNINKYSIKTCGTNAFIILS